MKKILIFIIVLILLGLAIWFVLKLSSDNKIKIDGNEITICGNGVVNEIIEDADADDLAIVQTIPPIIKVGLLNSLIDKVVSALRLPVKAMSSNESIGNYPVDLPISLFFSSKIYLESLKDNIIITDNGKEIKGNITFNESADGNAILSFTPFDEFLPDTEIIITIKKGLRNVAGRMMSEDLIIKYRTEAKTNSIYLEDNYGFEQGENGILLIGDAAVKKGTEALPASNGTQYLLMSTGKKIATENKEAKSGTSSIAILGSINRNVSNITFDYNFTSAEFNEYVNSKYDDCFMVTLTGNKGSYTEMITSINTIGKVEARLIDYPNMPDAGDDYAGQTGWKTKTIRIKDIGELVSITFMISDVSDKIYSSLVAIDNIKIH